MSKFKDGDRVVFKHWTEPYPFLRGVVKRSHLNGNVDVLVNNKCYYMPTDDGEIWHEEVFDSPLMKALR